MFYFTRNRNTGPAWAYVSERASASEQSYTHAALPEPRLQQRSLLDLISRVQSSFAARKNRIQSSGHFPFVTERMQYNGRVAERFK